MAVELFEHNRIAYESACTMLAETGKAAVIHPTGTGKSFIGFKLCEDNPEKAVLWLSPSEYIFKTQLENFKAAGGAEPGNITFATYQKFSMYTDDEIASLQVDRLVLDEFHRCGAQIWQKNISKFLELYPDVPVLGLTATAIRYLDNQRDMSEELFDGNVASEMTLGEAIVRGILNPPKYVLSVFSYQKDLEKYERRVRTARNKAVRDAAEKYLEALRRALEKADGLDVIFDKHMTDRTGKYIVFCANKEHMDEMMEKIGEWFAKVDKHPHVYSAYSDDPETSKAFADFKSDNSEHLKLLFCIDMLNEGIHVENVSGVILLRPTVSPIIYKQQIGRALSASKKTDAVIFDVVLNIENLYSIDAVKEEMQDALTYYRSLGEESLVINDRFRVIDEVHDCLELFNKLNDTLTAPWDVMYTQAKAYFETNGNLRVPAGYINESGYSLGMWISNQRQCRRGKNRGVLTAEQIAKLDAIGMIWDRIPDLRWEKNYAAAMRYYRKHGDLNVPVSHVSEDGTQLGKWLFYLRKTRRNASVYLTPEQVEALEKVGMVWDVLDYRWEKNYALACEYYVKNGNLEIPAAYVTKDGVRLGAWIHNLRCIRREKAVGSLSSEQIERLDRIGMQWESPAERQWRRVYRELKEYVGEYGTLHIRDEYRSKNGVDLNRWIMRQRAVYRSGKLSPERIQLLEEIGVTWTRPDIWNERFELAMDYYRRHHSLDIPGDVTVGGLKFKWWLSMQKKEYDSDLMPPERRELFAKLPLDELERDEWMEKFAKAAEYYKENGNLNVPAKYVTEDGFRLYEWVIHQKKMRKAGKLDKEREKLLNGIGIEWKKKDSWSEKYRYAKDYYDTHGNLDISGVYVCADGFRLGDWLSKARYAYQNGKLSAERIELLEKIGMTWDTQLDRGWMKRFELARTYYLEHGDLSLPTDYMIDGENLSVWIINQRVLRRKGKLSEDRVEKLSAIGMVWEHGHDVIWNRRYEAFKAYYDEHGTLEGVTRNTELKDGKAGQWLPVQRRYYKEGRLAAWQINKLNAIGMVWEPEDRWEIGYRHAAEYVERNGNLDVPSKYVCSDGYRLGNWIANQRTAHNHPSYHHKITAEQIDRLEKIGMIWDPSKAAWEVSYALAANYYLANGHLHISNNYVTESGYSLGMWIYFQREKHRNGSLSDECKQKLDSIGMDWLFPTERAWEDGYAAAERYFQKHGNLNVPEDFRDGDFVLGAWVRRQRESRDSLATSGANGNQILRLNAIGMVWKNPAQQIKADDLPVGQSAVAV